MQSKNHAMLDISKEKSYGPFSWIGFNNCKDAEPLQGDSVLLAALWYSFDLSFENYLQNPKQHTKVGSACSYWYHIIWNDPRGSVLSPLLFNVGPWPSKNLLYLFQWKNFWKWWKMLFVPSRKLFSFLRYIFIFVLTFWSGRKNDLARKIRSISKFTTWLTKNYNANIAQYPKK